MKLHCPEKQIALPKSVMFIEILIKGEAKLSGKNIKIASMSYFCIEMSNVSFFLKTAGREMVDLPAFILLLELDSYFRCLKAVGVKITMSSLFYLCFSYGLDLERISLARQGLQRWDGLCVSGETVIWMISSLLVKTIALFRRTHFIFRENTILEVFTITVQLHLWY